MSAQKQIAFVSEQEYFDGEVFAMAGDDCWCAPIVSCPKPRDSPTWFFPLPNGPKQAAL